MRHESIQTQGFISLEATEIPQLQGHVKHEVRAIQARKARYFLNQVEELLDSIKLWTNAQQVIKLRRVENDRNGRFLNVQLSLLQEVSNWSIWGHCGCSSLLLIANSHSMLPWKCAWRPLRGI